jgi:putative ABC transport system substrate-binding protein
MMKRRELITLLGGAWVVWPLVARAQQPKVLRVGFSGIMARGAPHYVAFEKRMAELGYQQGRNFTFEYIQSPSIDGYELTYRELAARKVDILLAAGNEPALRAARAAAGDATPIVFIALDFDPVERGYVVSRSRPGGNSTGIFVSQLELAGKRVELLREAFPKARRVGLFWDAASREQAEAAAAVAGRLGFEPRLMELAGQPDYSAALMPMDDSPGEPIMVPASPLALRDRATIASLLLERRAPSICAFREVMEAGALISYGVNLVDLFRDVAAFVDQVARGGKAGDTPMRAPSHYHIAFNLRTAKALGLEVPPMLLARADEVIE